MRAAALAVAVLLAVSACGDDDGGADRAGPIAERRSDRSDRDTGTGTGATPDEDGPGDDPGGLAGAPGDGGGEVAVEAPVDPARLAVDEPALAARLCPLDPRTVLPSSPTDPEQLRELLDATGDTVTELRSALLEVDGGDEVAAILDEVVASWSEAVRATDAGDDGVARDAVSAAADALARLHARADRLLIACAPG